MVAPMYITGRIYTSLVVEVKMHGIQRVKVS